MTKDSVTKLLWVDLEMTGLDVNKEVIIECAALVTDINLNVLDQYHAIVKQPQKYLDGMDEWNTKHHGASGLTAAVPNGKEPKDVEADLIDLVKKHFTNEKAILAGNSIGQDKLFIDKYFTDLAPLLHYRILDVSSWKVIMKHQKNITFEKKECHRASDDILESLEELKFYLQQFK